MAQVRQIVHLEYGPEIAFYQLQMFGLRQFCINPACLQFLTSVPNNERCRDRTHFAESSCHYAASAVTPQGAITRKISLAQLWRAEDDMGPSEIASVLRGDKSAMTRLPAIGKERKNAGRPWLWRAQIGSFLLFFLAGSSSRSTRPSSGPAPPPITSIHVLQP